MTPCFNNISFLKMVFKSSRYDRLPLYAAVIR